MSLLIGRVDPLDLAFVARLARFTERHRSPFQSADGQIFEATSSVQGANQPQKCAIHSVSACVQFLEKRN